MEKHVDLARGWASIRAQLEAERNRIVEEIRAYPTPIPRCDDQFNHLIERRERLSAELSRLDDIAGSSSAAPTDASRLEAFIDSSDCLDDDARLRLKSALNEALVASSLA